MNDVRTFLAESPIAKQTRLPATVILNREQTSSAALFAAKERGVFGPLEIDIKECALEIGGEVIAKGKIVRRRGKTYLKLKSAPVDGLSRHEVSYE